MIFFPDWKMRTPWGKVLINDKNSDFKDLSPDDHAVVNYVKQGSKLLAIKIVVTRKK